MLQRRKHMQDHQRHANLAADHMGSACNLACDRRAGHRKQSEHRYICHGRTFLEERGYIPNLKARLAYESFVTPDYFEHTLGSYVGNGFGVEPVLTQTAFFRPHNRSEDVSNLYLVGQSTQPGGGTPSVMMSAKMTVREIAKDFGIDARIVNGVPVAQAAAA